jgi:hypothetical protein
MPNYDTFVSALESSFDFHSARVIAKDAVSAAGLEDSSDWTDDELKLAAASIPAGGKDLRPVLVALGLVEEEPAPAPAAEEEESSDDYSEEE